MKEINICFENDDSRFDSRVSIIILMPFVPRIGDLIVLGEDDLRKVRNLIRRAASDGKSYAKYFDATAIDQLELVKYIEYHSGDSTTWVELGSDED